MIDWDKVADDAEKTPRGLLAEFLADIDEIDTIVIIARRYDPGEGDTVRYETSGSAFTALGLVQWAKICLEDHCAR